MQSIYRGKAICLSNEMSPHLSVHSSHTTARKTAREIYKHICMYFCMYICMNGSSGYIMFMIVVYRYMRLGIYIRKRRNDLKEAQRSRVIALLLLHLLRMKYIFLLSLFMYVYMYMMSCLMLNELSLLLGCILRSQFLGVIVRIFILLDFILFFFFHSFKQCRGIKFLRLY